MTVSIKRYNHNSILNYLLSVYIFFIPLWPLVPPFILAVMFGVLLFSKTVYKNNFSFVLKSPVMLFSSLYILMVLGMLWTADVSRGLEYLLRESPLILFPLFFSLYKMDAKTFSFIKRGLIAGCMVACIICLVHAASNFFITGSTKVFFYTQYSILLHPTYFSISLNISILLLIHELLNKWNVLNTKYRSGLLLVLTFFLLNIILLFAKMSLISTFITVVYFLIYEGKRHFKVIKVIKFTTIFLATFVLIVFVCSRMYNRFDQVTAAIESYNPETLPQNFKYYNSTTIRLIEWKMGVEIFLENWITGVGTGDIHDATMEKFVEKNFTYGITHFETPASQYLFFAIILGVFAVVIYLLCYALPFFISIKHSFYLYSAFLLLFALNSITDAILSASGVLLYGMFNAFLFSMLYQKMHVNK